MPAPRLVAAALRTGWNGSSRRAQGWLANGRGGPPGRQHREGCAFGAQKRVHMGGNASAPHASGE